MSKLVPPIGVEGKEETVSSSSSRERACQQSRAILTYQPDGIIQKGIGMGHERFPKEVAMTKGSQGNGYGSQLARVDFWAQWGAWKERGRDKHSRKDLKEGRIEWRIGRASLASEAEGLEGREDRSVGNSVKAWFEKFVHRNSFEGKFPSNELIGWEQESGVGWEKYSLV